MSSPAERYAAARRPAAQERTELHSFRTGLDFELDDFQVEACSALEAGQGVLVAAPTGAGKTVVGEFAVHLGFARGAKTFYTTPIKALSNQKYADFVDAYGEENVGLLTGDTSVNGDAPVVVMTTEVLRNMIYAGSRTLDSLGYVVLDEVHYLADRFRGPVWEEVILNLAQSVRLVALSATVSNAEELGEWLTEVRGSTRVVVSERRPVPLWQHMLVGDRLLDLHALGEGHTHRTAPIADPPLNPDLVDAIRAMNRDERAGPHGRRAGGPGRGGQGRRGGGRAGRGTGSGGRGRRGGPDRDGAGRDHGGPHRADARTGGGRSAYGPRRGGRVLPRYAVVEILDRADLLPAIVFIFSRAACEDAVLQVLTSGVRLTSKEEARRIRAVVDEALAGVPLQDLAVLGVETWQVALERGIAAHHAGMLPVLKQTVERLFAAGLVKVVFATETLALGINMPARSVVLEKLVKWDGTAHVNLTPGEYTQLTGRAGRRGIDVEGHAVVQWRPGVDPVHVGSLASRRTYPLRSAFRPTYNMAVNLLRHRTVPHARELLEMSFAQFQADRAVVGLAREARRLEEAMAGYAKAMECHLGDFTEYARLRQAITDREKSLSRERAGERRRAAARSLAGARVGDVVAWARGRRTAHAVVLETADGGFDGPDLRVLTTERQLRHLTAADAPDGVSVVASVRVPKNFSARDTVARRRLADAATTALSEAAVPDVDHGAGGEDGELRRLRAQLRAHPCHGCSEREDHARWSHRWLRTRSDLDALSRRITGRTGTLAVEFDHVAAVLTELGYLEATDGGIAVTDDGVWLGRLYAERDLTLAQILREGMWDDLEPEELAAALTSVVFEGREDRLPQRIVSDDALGRALMGALDVARQVADIEQRHRVRPSSTLDLGLVDAMLAWADGASLARSLELCELGAGDFVRWAKQLLDVLDQVAVAAPDVRLAQNAAIATTLVRRGVVAWSGI